MNISWYPGHMRKTKKSLKEDLFLIDVVIELLDARIPLSSKNHEIDFLLGNKKKILLLNKSDLANKKATNKFIELYKKENYACLEIDSLHKKNFRELNKIIEILAREKNKKLLARGRIFSPLRIIVVGIPNVGKSSFINKFVNKNVAKAENKPGVTLCKQWIKINKNIELLDTPGILEPKFDDKKIIYNLVFVRAIKKDNFDAYDLALNLIEKLNRIDKKILIEHYKIKFDAPEQQIQEIAKNRGYIKKANEFDLNRTANILLNNFADGTLGKITLD